MDDERPTPDVDIPCELPRGIMGIPAFPTRTLFGQDPGPGVDCQDDPCLAFDGGAIGDFTTNRTVGVADRLYTLYVPWVLWGLGLYPNPVVGELVVVPFLSVAKRTRFCCVCSACIAASNNSFMLDASGV